MRTRIILLSILISTIAINSCKKDPENNTEPSFFRALINGRPWTASAISVKTTPVPNQFPAELTAQLGDERISIKIPTTTTGTTTFRTHPATIVNLRAELFESGFMIKWSSGTETNVYRYILEQSTDGTNWMPRGGVAATGAGSNYQYNASTGFKIDSTLMYRLRIEDNDATYTFSPVIMVATGYSAYYQAASADARRGYEGTLNISEISSVDRLVRGTFNFKVKSANGEIFEITTGQFFVNY